MSFWRIPLRSLKEPGFETRSKRLATSFTLSGHFPLTICRYQSDQIFPDWAEHLLRLQHVESFPQQYGDWILGGPAYEICNAHFPWTYEWRCSSRRWNGVWKYLWKVRMSKLKKAVWVSLENRDCRQFECSFWPSLHEQSLWKLILKESSSICTIRDAIWNEEPTLT